MKEEFIARLRNAKTEQEWNSICNEVKEYTETLPYHERDGHYPKWWYVDVICSITHKFK